MKDESRNINPNVRDVGLCTRAPQKKTGILATLRSVQKAQTFPFRPEARILEALLEGFEALANSGSGLVALNCSFAEGRLTNSRQNGNTVNTTSTPMATRLPTLRCCNSCSF